MDAASERFRILALDGGGIRGAYTASVLASLEAATGQKCCERFDLITGTSTGGLLAIGLSVGIPARDLADFYKAHGPTIFPLTGMAERARGMFRQIFRPKYDSTALRAALDSVLGDAVLGDARTRLVIPAYDITEGRIFAFKTAHHERFQFDIDVPAVEIALATSAAPTYFPAQLIADHAMVEYVDGGVWANTPSLVGIVEAVGFLEQDLETIDVLSIGTTEPVPDFSRDGGSGAVEWGTGLINLFVTAQSQAAVAMAGLLANTHHRINAVVPNDWSAMDDIVKVRELMAIGHNDAKKDVNLTAVRSRFLSDKPVEAFTPLKR